MSREETRALFKKHHEADDVLGFFEALYANAGGDTGAIPWADLEPNPRLVAWLKEHDVRGERCLVVGCGLGDDAAALAAAGARVTAFDVSPTAVKWARERWAEQPIDFAVADALDTPAEWRGGFDRIVEIYTIQALTADLRRRALDTMARNLAPGGQLLVICRGRDDSEAPGEGPPWRLSLTELSEPLKERGLRSIEHSDGLDDETPPVRRFVSLWERPEA